MFSMPSPMPSPFVSPFPSPIVGNTPQQNNDVPRPPELDLPRALNYYADYSGCGFWRMILPEHLLKSV